MISHGNLSVDDSECAEGRFSAAVVQRTQKPLKLRVTNGAQSLTYSLKNTGEPEFFPLQLGNGGYTVRLYENVMGNTYKPAGEIIFQVRLNNMDAPFLRPNQYVNYSDDSEVVSIAKRICKGKGTAEIVKSICNYVKVQFAYDYVKALTVKAGALPDIEGTVKKRMGICQDLSAVIVAMLRSRCIPARLAIGYADKQYHAWAEIKSATGWERYDPTAEICATKKPKVYSVERVY